jgi:tripartite-type tricarboxylate transporter receptor subunit TctC
MRYRYSAAALLMLATLLAAPAHAQDAASFPSKPVRVLLGFAPGGATDIQARLFSQKLAENLRQQFIVENRPSADGAVAMGMVAKAAPDGYNLLAVTATLTIPHSASMNLPDPIKDFAPVSHVSRAPLLLVVHPSVPAKSVRELILLAKSRPGKMNFGGSPTGSIIQLATLWFFSLAGVNATYVPYSGTGPSSTALSGGHVDAAMGSVISIGHHVKSGRLRALGVTYAQRSRMWPDLPAIAEQGVPGFEYIAFHGWVAPAGTPAAIVNKLSAEIARVAKLPEVADKLKDDGAEPVGSTPEQFRQLIAAEVPRWKKVVQDAGIRID